LQLTNERCAYRFIAVDCAEDKYSLRACSVDRVFNRSVSYAAACDVDICGTQMQKVVESLCDFGAAAEENGCEGINRCQKYFADCRGHQLTNLFRNLRTAKKPTTGINISM